MKYILGIDVGIASVGWSILNLDQERIESLGVRTFVAAENPQDGSSLALPRRLARGMRRRIRRRAHRLERIRNLLVNINLLTTAELNCLYEKAFDKDPYLLRVEGLDRLLIPEEWARVLIHIAKHRGFKSNRKSETADSKSESSKLLSGVERNRKILLEKGYRTVGEMFVKDSAFIEHKRNKAGEYLNTVSRDMLEDEIQILFDFQRKSGNPFATPEIEERYVNIFSSQRPFMSKELLESMIGKCTFEKNEKRAPKNCYTAERFVLLSKVNSLRLIRDGNYVELTLEQKQKISALAYKNSEVKYKQIRKILELDSKDLFCGLYYGGAKDPEEACFVKLKGFHMLKKVLATIADGERLMAEPEKIDFIAEILTFNKGDAEITKEMFDAGFSSEIIEAILPLSFSKVQHLSIKAMKKLLPFLEEGLRYDEACTKVGYVFYRPNQGTKGELLPEIPVEEIRNPVVIRGLSQTRKIINEIIRTYGSPYRVHIELARNMTQPFDERKRIEREQDKFRQEKERLSQEFMELHHRYPSGLDLLKYRLWKEQNGFCLYCQKYLEPDKIFDTGYADIDHIIPYSRSFDDSMSNKVIVCGEQNKVKGARTPYEFFGGDSKRWEEYAAFVNNNIRNGSKRQKLLRTKFNTENENEMKSRHLNDTRYISRFLAIFLEDNLKFSEDNVKSKRVFAVNGQIT